MCTKLVFQRLLVKLATESTFQINYKLYKQLDGCCMDGPLSVTFADIFYDKNGKHHNCSTKTNILQTLCQ